MKLAPPSSRPSSDSNMIPMINVVFLLLIFFMVAGSIEAPVPVDAQPPESSQRQNINAQRTLHVSANGTLFLDEQPVVLADLSNALAAAPAVFPTPATGPSAGTGNGTPVDTPVDDPPLALRADAKVSVGQLRELIAALRSAGVAQVELVTTWVPVPSP